MRLAGVACVKNEEDVIEAFVRHNLASLDELWVVDDGSEDQTPLILEKLQEERLSVKLLASRWTAGHHQRENTAQLLQALRNAGGADWTFLLDADEFLWPGPESVRAVLGRLRLDEGEFPVLPWANFVITEADPAHELNPVLRLRHHAPVGAGGLAKALMPRRLAEDARATVSAGNHFLEIEGAPLRARRIPQLRLAHFSVRSPVQMILKNNVFYLQCRVHSGAGNPTGESRARLAKLAGQDFAAAQRLVYRWLPPHLDREGWEDGRSFAMADLVENPLPYAGQPLRYTPPQLSAERACSVLFRYALKLADTVAAGPAPPPESNAPPAICLRIVAQDGAAGAAASGAVPERLPREITWAFDRPVGADMFFLLGPPCHGFLSMESVVFRGASTAIRFEGPDLDRILVFRRKKGWRVPVLPPSCVRIALTGDPLRIGLRRPRGLAKVTAITIRAAMEPQFLPLIERYILEPVHFLLKRGPRHTTPWSRIVRRARRALRRFRLPPWRRADPGC